MIRREKRRLKEILNEFKGIEKKERPRSLG